MLRAWLHIKPVKLMKRAKLAKPNLRQKGFSPIELLLAATVFGLLTTALIGAIIYGRESTAKSGDRERALLLAEEGLEAARNIAAASYANLVDTAATGLGQSGSQCLSQTSQWAFSGTSDTCGIYTRQIAIAVAGTDRKRVTATVSWPHGNGTSQASVETYITNWTAAIAPTITPGPIMMAYSKTTTTPFYRIWDGTNWGAEASAQNVVGNINYVVLKSARTRNEAILGVQTSTGAIYIQIWNGSTWGNLLQVGTGPTTTRSFDIAYEKNSDEALIVYAHATAPTDITYRTWNGTTLSGQTTNANPPTTGAINWIELEANPLSASNDVAMMMLDANADVYGMTWSGTAWSTMGVSTVWDASAASATKKSIDVEYEQTAGRAMFMWGDSLATDQYYRLWNGTTLGSAIVLDIAAEGGVPEWVQLAARPSSNEIMLGVQDATATPNLNTRKWSGSTWDTATQHPEHDASLENVASRNFDIVWETHTGNLGEAWLVWGDANTTTVRQWSGTAWGTASVLGSSDDTAFVRLKADPVSGAVFAGIYEDTTSANDDIWESRLTGGGTAWSAKNTIWAGPTTAQPVHFRIDIATP